MNISELGRVLGTAYRQKLIAASETAGQAHLVSQWQREWDDTDQGYRGIWAAVALLAVGQIEQARGETVDPPELPTELMDTSFDLSDLERTAHAARDRLVSGFQDDPEGTKGSAGEPASKPE